MISPAAIRIIVLIRTFTQGEECGINLLITETSKKPIIKLTSRTFTSLSKIALIVFEPGSLYLNEKDSELSCIRKRKKSATVQLIAIKKMIGSLRLFTADPVGTISFERPMIKI